MYFYGVGTEIINKYDYHIKLWVVFFWESLSLSLSFCVIYTTDSGNFSIKRVSLLLLTLLLWLASMFIA